MIISLHSYLVYNHIVVTRLRVKEENIINSTIIFFSFVN